MKLKSAEGYELPSGVPEDLPYWETDMWLCDSTDDHLIVKLDILVPDCGNIINSGDLYHDCLWVDLVTVFDEYIDNCIGREGAVHIGRFATYLREYADRLDYFALCNADAIKASQEADERSRREEVMTEM